MGTNKAIPWRALCVLLLSFFSGSPKNVWGQPAEAPPYASTQQATSITGTDAILGGMATPNAPNAVAWFEWGSNSNFGFSNSPVSAGSGFGVVRITTTISNLAPAQVYHFRLVVSNSLGIERGADQLLCTGGRIVVWGDNSHNQTNAPANVFNATAVAAGWYHGLALTSYGYVIAWGAGTTYTPEDGYNFGQALVPGQSTRVAAIAAGGDESMALLQDGTVVAWGYDEAGETSPPAGLSNVIAMATDGFVDLALKSDGTVIAWGDQPNVPLGLSNIVAITAGEFGFVALKNDGTVVNWGSGVTTNSGGVVAISGGLELFANGIVESDDGQQVLGPGNFAALSGDSSRYDASGLAIQEDGTLTVWGDDTFGQTNPPAGLSEIGAIATGQGFNIALQAPGLQTDSRVLASSEVYVGSLGQNIPVYLYGFGTGYRIVTLPEGGTLYQTGTALPITEINTEVPFNTATYSGSLYFVPSNYLTTGNPYATFQYVVEEGFLISAPAEGSIVITTNQYGPPSNDNFENRTVIDGTSISFGADNGYATSQPGEPIHSEAVGNDSSSSVWYSWLAPSTGGVILDITLNFRYAIIVAAYTGNDLASLVKVGDDASTFEEARLAFTAVAGETYQIAIDSAYPDAGGFEFSLQLTPAPANDLFANATVISGSFYTNSGSFFGASREAGEPSHGQTNFLQTLWWTWQAPANIDAAFSHVTLTADAVSFAPAIGVYTGNSLANLMPVPLSQRSVGLTTLVSFNATPGAVYQIALAGEEQNPAGNVISPRWGNYDLRLNNSLLALTISNISTSPDPDPNVSFDFTADARIDNLSSNTTDSLQVSVFDLSGVSVQGQDAGAVAVTNISEGVFPAIPAQLPPGGSMTVTISGSVPNSIGQENDLFGIGYGAYAELQEQSLGTNWFPIEDALVIFGNWPALGGNPGPDGGVIRVDPALPGSSNPWQVIDYVINGSDTVPANGAADFSATVTFSNGSSEKTIDFTNTVWKATPQALATISSNGVFSAGGATSNTSVQISVEFSYQSVNYTTTKTITVLGPLEFGNIGLLPNNRVHFTISGKPQTTYVLETALSLSPSTIWTPEATNTTDASGQWPFTNAVSSGVPARFFRIIPAP